MKKTLTALAAAAVLAAGTMAVPKQAEAHPWWVVPAIVAGTVVVGGAIVAGTHAAHAGYYAPQYAPRYAPRGAVRVAPVRGCYLEERPGLWGYRYVEVCR